MVELLDESALQTRLLHTSELSDNQYEEFIEMCCAAYGEDMASILKKVGAGWHVLGTLDGALVSHAMWVVRELQTGSGHELNTAYVEAVATLPEHQGRGFATIVMQHLQNEMYEYEFSALSPADTTLYERLGWEHWRGELFIRSGGQLEATPDESILVMRLPRTPDNVSLNDSLSAEWRPGEVW
ncbi:MAG: GNAT family N-acetyltransferase [Woeseiaceae bacterium]